VNVNFTSPFVVNSTEYFNAYIYTDGYITLGERVFQTPYFFPFVSPPIIAPSATDLISSTGNIYYRLTTDDLLLQAINAYVLDYDTDVGDGGSIVEALVVSWVNVPLAFASDITLSFQAILATTGARSYVSFLFSNSTNFGGPLVGINYGDGFSYHQESSEAGIEFRSNVNGVVGFFFYRMDGRSNGTTATQQPETTDPGNTDAPTSDVPISSTSTPAPVVSCTFDKDLRVLRRGSARFVVTNGRPEIRTDLQGIELCYSGTFNPICSTFTSSADATAICRSAGANYQSEWQYSHLSNSVCACVCVHVYGKGNLLHMMWSLNKWV